MYKNIIYFYFSFHYPKCTYGLSERESKMEEMHTHTHKGNSVDFMWNLFAFLLRSARIEIFPSLYNFLDAYTILVVTPPAYILAVGTHAVYHLHIAYGHTTFWHATDETQTALCWENTCIFFTLGNRIICCYATHTIYVVC